MLKPNKLASIKISQLNLPVCASNTPVSPKSFIKKKQSSTRVLGNKASIL
jgi:hypothetical protein